MTRPYIIDADGKLSDRAHNPIILPSVQDTEVEVPHLLPFVLTVTLPKKQDMVKILVSFSSHCWTKTYTSDHSGQMKIYDHNRERAFDKERYQLSTGLSDLMNGLLGHKCYLTPTKRNYMAANASITWPNGENYWIFFVLKKRKGKWNGIRYHLEMFVESAYLTSPKLGTASSFANIVSQAMRGE